MDKMTLHLENYSEYGVADFEINTITLLSGINGTRKKDFIYALAAYNNAKQNNCNELYMGDRQLVGGDGDKALVDIDGYATEISKKDDESLSYVLEAKEGKEGLPFESLRWGDVFKDKGVFPPKYHLAYWKAILEDGKKNQATESNPPLYLLCYPEKGLHAQWQSQIGHDIVTLAGFGMRVVVSTHSEHVLHGIMISLKNGLHGLTYKDLTVHHFTRDKEDKLNHQRLVMDKNATFCEYPDEFFDQWQNDLMQIV